MHVVDPQAVKRQGTCESLRIRAMPMFIDALEITEIALSQGNRVTFVIGDDVDHTICLLNIAWSDSLGRKTPQSPAFDHRWPSHTNIALASRDDDVAATKEYRVTRKASSGNDTDERYSATQTCKPRKGLDMKRSCGNNIYISWSSSAAFSKQNQWNIRSRTYINKAILLIVIELSLRPGEYRVIVCNNSDMTIFWKSIAMNCSDARNYPVGRRVLNEIFKTASLALGSDYQRPDLTQTANIE